METEALKKPMHKEFMAPCSRMKPMHKEFMAPTKHAELGMACVLTGFSRSMCIWLRDLSCISVA